MPGTPKSVVVKVALRGDNPVDFDVKSDDLPTDANGNLVFQNDHHPGFKINFELSDQSGLGYKFPPNSKKNDALWSKLGASSCPKSAAHDVFSVVEVKPSLMTLVALNPNPKPAQLAFCYTLRVTKDGGQTYLALDPGGMNQNGPSQRSSTALVFVAGAITGSLATLGTQALLAS